MGKEWIQEKGDIQEWAPGSLLKVSSRCESHPTSVWHAGGSCVHVEGEGGCHLKGKGQEQGWGLLPSLLPLLCISLIYPLSTSPFL